MECRYTYTAREQGRALGADRRLKLTRSIFLCIFIWVVLNYLMDDPDSDYSTPLMLSAIILLALCLTPLWNLRHRFLFRWSIHLDQPMRYVLEDGGIVLQTPLMGQSVSWAAIGHAGETNDGFLLYWGKSRGPFSWLPKSGFDSQDAVISCRNLLLKNVRKFQQVRIRRSIVSRIGPRPATRTPS
jgi:hypothetical protein